MMIERLFPMHLREAAKKLEKIQDLEEIRVRIGQPLFLYTSQKELVLAGNTFLESQKQQLPKNVYRMTEQDILEIQNYISDYSLYAWQEELRNGFLTVQGGHRIGLSGSTSNHEGKIKGLSYLTFFNIRIARERFGCADGMIPYIKKEPNTIYNTLLVSAPAMGKTTLLRDCIRRLSYDGMKMAVVDERLEISASYHGIPQNDMGPRTDVLDGCNKPEGIRMLLRAMSPQVIAVDELGTEQDFIAVEEAAYSGCKVIGTVHAGSIKELQQKSVLKKWCEAELFERFILIEKGEDGIRRYQIYNDKGKMIF